MTYAAKSGIDLVGVAPAERFLGLEPQVNPLSIFPQAKSILICAREIPRGTFRGIEEGTLWTRAGRLIEATYMYQLARYLEDEGGIAVPSSPMAAERWPEGVVFRGGKVAPNVYPDLEYAVIACGLGEIGTCGLVLTPQFGIRQSLGLIITDLEIEPDPVFQGSVCDREQCSACIAACPLGALDRQKTISRTVCGVTYSVAATNKDKCRYCPNGAFADTSHSEAMPNRLTAACARACLAHLDAAGTLTRQYKTPFRRRPAWGVELGEI
jgi:epoxyqueuosine reductase QueG